MEALTWEGLDAYGKREETVTAPSGAKFRVKSLAYWDMEEWGSGLDIVVKVYTATGLRRFWPYKAYASRGYYDDPVPERPHAQEAAMWVATEIERLRSLSYDDLMRRQEQPEHRPVETSDGKRLILETQIFWDDRKRQNLRVLVDVWDPAKRVSLGSITKDDFIRAPDGSFVGE